MSSIYEWIETGDNLPFDVSLHGVSYVPSHWHTSIEMIFVLQGKLEVTIGNDKHTLSEGDVLLINQCHVHEVIGLDMNIIVTFLIPVTYIKDFIYDIENISFECYSRTIVGDKRQALDRIRYIMADMVQLQNKMPDTYTLEMQVRLLHILSILMKQFKLAGGMEPINQKYMDRMLRIITYIENHYQEPITLQMIADREYLSVPYLSKFFSEQIGLNFQSYVTSIRLKNTVEDLLLNEELPIADLAMKHGFPNAKSFYTAFKNKYQMTPNEYRKQYHPTTSAKQTEGTFNYLEFNQSNALGIIQEYLEQGQSLDEGLSADVKAMETLLIPLACEKEPIKLRHTWRNLITIGKAKEGLHADVQAHIRYVQAKVGFQYVRFHGIFDDGMMVYHEDNGEPVFNFRFIDQLFDFLLSVGLKPFVEIGFMPYELAKDPHKSVFYKKSYISPPMSIDRWCELVEAFLLHCLNRYGAEEVETWHFEFWNEPELSVFWSGTVDEYLELYHRTYQVMKGCSNQLKIGAPGRILGFKSVPFFAQFIRYCREHACMPDFIPIHFYPHEDGLEAIDHQELLDGRFRMGPYRKLFEEFGSIHPNPDFLKERLVKEQELLEEHGLGELPLFLTEWNSTAYHRELTNDTLYKAAYIVKNILENLDRIDGFGYWVLSDNIEETPASNQLFHGGLGLIAQFGIPKAAMHAYELLAKLGTWRIAQGEHYIMTTEAGRYQLLLYNYCHFDNWYALGDVSFVHVTNRYSAFKEDKTLRMELELKGLKSGRYRMTRHTISRQQGSSYDAWVTMGAPSYVNANEIEYLKGNTRPKMQMEHITIEEGTRVVSILEPHSVELIELEPIVGM